MCCSFTLGSGSQVGHNVQLASLCQNQLCAGCFACNKHCHECRCHVCPGLQCLNCAADTQVCACMSAQCLADRVVTVTTPLPIVLSGPYNVGKCRSRHRMRQGLQLCKDLQRLQRLMRACRLRRGTACYHLV